MLIARSNSQIEKENHMPNICPCCHRRISAPRKSAGSQIDKRLEQDIARANAAISALATAEQRLGLTGPEWRAAIESESQRMQRAIADHRLLWSIYRRTDKTTPYYESQPVAEPQPAVEPQSVAQPEGELVAA
jgi:hypothetical protein